jgi:hypothetical protein
MQKYKKEIKKLNQDILTFSSPPKKDTNKNSEKIFNKSPHIVVKKTKLVAKKKTSPIKK